MKDSFDSVFILYHSKHFSYVGIICADSFCIYLHDLQQIETYMSSHVSCFLYTLFSRLFGAFFAYLFTRLAKIYLAPKTFPEFAQLPPESTARPSLKWPNEPAWRQQRSSIAQTSVTPPPPTPTHLIQPPFASVSSRWKLCEILATHCFIDTQASVCAGKWSGTQVECVCGICGWQAVHTATSCSANCLRAQANQHREHLLWALLSSALKWAYTLQTYGW